MYYVMSYNGKTNARAGHKNCTVVAREGKRKGIGNVFLLLYDFTILSKLFCARAEQEN